MLKIGFIRIEGFNTFCTHSCARLCGEFVDPQGMKMRMVMYGKIIKNDIQKSKLITLTITAFILAAAMLTSLTASLSVNLFGAIDAMLIQSRVMDFLQMHTGDIDMAELQRFADENPSVEEYQVLPFLNIEGEDIILGGETLAESVQDNGVSVQSERFDFLLGLNGEVLHPENDEIYLAVYYMDMAGIGSAVSICGVPFTVAGYLRDSTMNAALVGSKRFLVSAEGFEKVREFGKMENLIEFRLTEGASIPEFEAAYIEAGMPANGPPVVTKPLIRLMNSVTDGIMLAVMVLIVVLVIIVAFLCIRLTLLAKIEEDYREIGVLKALGMRVGSIKKLYLAKYGFLAGAACVLGFLVSIPLQEPFMRNIRLYMGESNSLLPSLFFAVLGAALIYAVVLLYVNGVLEHFRKISAAQAIRFGAPEEKSKSARGFRLSRNKLFSPNIFLGIKDVFSRKKLYLTMLMVLIISAFVMIVPQNIYNTISADSFITYMGMGICDLNISIMGTQSDDVRRSAAELSEELAVNNNVAQYVVIHNMIFDRLTDDGSIERMRVNLGDRSVFPIAYLQGRAPEKENEIALSALYTDDLQKTIGDEIVLIVDGEQKRLTICGTYSDITNGGRTAQALFEVKSGVVLMSGISVSFRNRETAHEEILRYREMFPFAKVTGIGEMIEQTFGPMQAAVKTASYVAVFAAILLTILVTVLFMKMLVTKDRHSIAVLKSISFTSADIRVQYLTRSIILAALGLVAGTVLANTLGEYAGMVILSAFGVSSINFIANPWFAYLFSPLLITVCVYISTLIGIADIRPVKISEHIKEA